MKDVVGTVLYLAGAGQVTGEVIHVDGGISFKPRGTLTLIMKVWLVKTFRMLQKTSPAAASSFLDEDSGSFRVAGSVTTERSQTRALLSRGSARVDLSPTRKGLLIYAATT